jgi:nucleotide-binding universal stress UspA family protein
VCWRVATHYENSRTPYGTALACCVNMLETIQIHRETPRPPMFERLLLALDDSPASEAATAFAAAVATGCSASVHVFHVNELQVGGRGVSLKSTEECLDFVTEAVLELRAHGVTVGGSAVCGTYREVANRIADAAVVQKADAIILGSQRRPSRLGGLFSPNVRERTIRLSALPVLTAPSPLHVSVQSALRIDDVLGAYATADLTTLPTAGLI